MEGGKSMSMREALDQYEGQIIHVQMTGFPSAMQGLLNSVANDWFIMATVNSEMQFFDMSKLITFWPHKE